MPVWAVARAVVERVEWLGAVGWVGRVGGWGGWGEWVDKIVEAKGQEVSDKMERKEDKRRSKR